MPNIHDWDEIDARAILLVEGGKVNNVSEIARALNVPRGTLSAHYAEMGLTDQNLSELASIIERWNREHGVAPIEKIYEDKGGNRWGITAVDRRIKTLDDLIEVCGIDLSVWSVDHWVANKWEFGVANRIKRDGSATIHPLYQVKAWLHRKEPLAIKPVIKPIEVSVKIPKPTPSKQKIKRSLQIADIQGGFRKNVHTGELIPFHDRRALDVALQIAQSQHFDDITFMGDELDLSEWTTRWQIEPEFYHTTQAILIEMHWWLAQFRQAAPNAVIDMLSGNHDRFKDAIVQHLRSAYDLRPADELDRDAILTMPRMLALDKLHIGYIDGYKNGTAKKWLTDNLYLTHSDIARNTPGATAGATVAKNYASSIIAHIHRRELATKTVKLRDERIETSAFCPGCVCHIDGRVPGSKEDSQWQQGISVTETNGNNFNIIPIAINDGVAIYNGQVFTARSRDKEAQSLIAKHLEKIAQIV